GRNSEVTRAALNHCPQYAQPGEEHGVSLRFGNSGGNIDQSVVARRFDDVRITPAFTGYFEVVVACSEAVVEVALRRRVEAAPRHLGVRSGIVEAAGQTDEAA